MGLREALGVRRGLCLRAGRQFSMAGRQGSWLPAVVGLPGGSCRLGPEVTADPRVFWWALNLKHLVGIWTGREERVEGHAVLCPSAFVLYPFGWLVTGRFNGCLVISSHRCKTCPVPTGPCSIHFTLGINRCYSLIMGGEAPALPASASRWLSPSSWVSAGSLASMLCPSVPPASILILEKDQDRPSRSNNATLGLFLVHPASGLTSAFHSSLLDPK